MVVYMRCAGPLGALREPASLAQFEKEMQNHQVGTGLEYIRKQAGRKTKVNTCSRSTNTIENNVIF